MIIEFKIAKQYLDHLETYRMAPLVMKEYGIESEQAIKDKWLKMNEEYCKMKGWRI